MGTVEKCFEAPHIAEKNIFHVHFHFDFDFEPIFLLLQAKLVYISVGWDSKTVLALLLKLNNIYFLCFLQFWPKFWVVYGFLNPNGLFWDWGNNQNPFGVYSLCCPTLFLKFSSILSLNFEWIFGLFLSFLSKIGYFSGKGKGQQLFFRYTHKADYLLFSMFSLILTINPCWN